MLEFDVAQFVRYSDILQRLQHEIEEENERNGVPLTPQEQIVCATHMHQIRNFLAPFEFDTGRCFERVEIKIHNPERATVKLSELLRELRHRIDDELRKRLFMFIPAKDAEYYNHAALFGPEVAAKFPKANEEITEAGSCYATGNYTACVFHLMRVVEHGARALVKGLGAQKFLKDRVELSEWGHLVNALDEGLKPLAVGKRKSVRVTEKFEFYNHALAQFRNFKDAWRNNVSHTRKTYPAGQAKDIMDNTRQFMQHLAIRLKEQSR